MAKKDTEEEAGMFSPNSEKLKALQAAMDKIEKNFGKGSIMKLGDEHVEQVEVIPTGSIALNAALGVGGYPKGRIIEIYGPESSGKTTLAIHAIAEAQKAGLGRKADRRRQTQRKQSGRKTCKGMQEPGTRAAGSRSM